MIIDDEQLGKQIPDPEQRPDTIANCIELNDMESLDLIYSDLVTKVNRLRDLMRNTDNLLAQNWIDEIFEIL